MSNGCAQDAGTAVGARGGCAQNAEEMRGTPKDANSCAKDASSAPHAKDAQNELGAQVTISALRNLRTGLGLDVHAFAPDRALILGGVEIPHVQGLAGHSDADVLVHAIMDALLGAARAGDIGKLFPDTDPAYKGANSIELARHVAAHVRAKGFEIIDIDSVIAAQEPKLSPYRDQMRLNIARALEIPTENIGIKATTTEHLGFEGRCEGISAYATCMLAIM